MEAKQLGKYTLLREIGRGGMGAVFQARDEVIGRDVAIKLILEQVLHVPTIRERFYREASSAGRLTHENIVVVHDVGEHDDMPFIVMELLRGRSLRELIGGGKLLLEQKLSIAVQLCEGLGFAHQNGVIHRDVKPENVQVQDGNRIKILDFGIARLADDGQTATRSSVGTPRYMSPEQIMGSGVDHRTDIFSFGVVLYEMLTGINPFTGDNVTTVIYKILHETPPAIQIGDPSISRDLQPIVSRCLSKSAAERYPDFAAVAADLRAFIVHRQLGSPGDSRLSALLVDGEGARTLPSGITARTAEASLRIQVAKTARNPARLVWGSGIGMAGALVAGGLYFFALAPKAGAPADDAGAAGLTVQSSATSIGADVAALRDRALQARSLMESSKARADSVSAAEGAAAPYNDAGRLAQDGLAALGADDAGGYERAEKLFIEAEARFATAAQEAVLARLTQEEVEKLRRFAEQARRAANSVSGQARTVPSGEETLREAERDFEAARKQLAEGTLEDAARGYGEAARKYRQVVRLVETRTATAKQGAEKARAEAQEAQRQSAGFRSTASAAGAFRRAETLMGDADRQLAGAAYDQAAETYRQALSAFAEGRRIAEAQPNPPPETPRRADEAKSAMAAARRSVAEGHRQAPLFPQAEAAEKAADQLYAAAEYDRAAARYDEAARLYTTLAAQPPPMADPAPPAAPELPPAEDYVRTLSARVRAGFQEEDLKALQAISPYFSAWGDFFRVASGVTLEVSTGEVNTSGSSARFSMRLNIRYKNNKNEPNSLEAPLVWTIERAGPAWRVANVAAAR